MNTDKQKTDSLDNYLVIRPLLTNIECGDAGVIKAFDNKVFMGIIDVLGHGRDACKVAVLCKDFLKKNYEDDLIKIMNGLHQYIKGSRGAVVGLSLLDSDNGALRYVGVGNITARIFGPGATRILSGPGIVGYIMPTPRQEEIELSDGDVLVLHTDGVKEHFELEDYPGLLKDKTQTIARRIVRQFGKKEDDAACMVLRYKK